MMDGDGAIERARRLHAQQLLEAQQREQRMHWWRCPNCGNSAIGGDCNNCGWCGGIVRTGTPLPPEPPLVVSVPPTLQDAISFQGGTITGNKIGDGRSVGAAGVSGGFSWEGWPADPQSWQRGAPPVPAPTPEPEPTREAAESDRAATEARVRISVLERAIANLRADRAMMTTDAVDDVIAQIHAMVKAELR